MSSSLSHFRETARFGTEQPAESHLSRSDLVPIRDLVVPTQVQPNTAIGVTVVIGNNAQIISPFERDVCTTGGFNGFLLRVTLLVNGQEIDRQTECVSAAGAGREFNLQFISPGSGELDLELLVEGANSGNELHRVVRTVTVTGDAPPSPEPNGSRNGDGDGDGDGDGGGPLLPCFLDPNRGCERLEAGAWTAVLVLAVAVLLGR